MCTAAPALCPANSGSHSSLPGSARCARAPTLSRPQLLHRPQLKSAANPATAGDTRNTPTEMLRVSSLRRTSRARSSSTRAGRESAYQPRRPCHATPPGPALMSQGNRIKKPVPGTAASVRAVTKLPRKQQR
ncbi:hypothetical protein NDU88_001007 [Pleurodeles waltl]|uniref:Uncharacterized protein n=1 Tax=Pleurodeles waltl TaxID=8319 RepID=A0AAV7KX99_PLEWA|nr:hypothetical protein NDU88_001007 [Pleurodeles waltl]